MRYGLQYPQQQLYMASLYGSLFCDLLTSALNSVWLTKVNNSTPIRMITNALENTNTNSGLKSFTSAVNKKHSLIYIPCNTYTSIQPLRD